MLTHNKLAKAQQATSNYELW